MKYVEVPVQRDILRGYVTDNDWNINFPIYQPATGVTDEQAITATETIISVYLGLGTVTLRCQSPVTGTRYGA